MSAIPIIRVAVLTRGETLEAWEVAALQKVRELSFAQIVLEIRDATPVNERSFGEKVSEYKWSRLFWNKWFKRAGNCNSTRLTSTNEIFKGISRIDVTPELKGKHTQYFSSADVDKVKQYSPDVIIRFGFNILRGEILNVAPHGVWSFHHADHEKIRGGPAGFWEYILGHNTTGAILQRLTDKLDDGVVLRTGHWSLVKHSFRENLDFLLHNTVDWIANALTELHLQGKIVTRHIGKDGDSRTPVFSYPGNFRMIQFWFILCGNKIGFHWRNLFCPETWKIGIVDQAIGDVLINGIHSQPKWVHAEESYKYLADPFSINYNGKDIILAEEYSYREQKGRIINTESGETFAASQHHSSFPYPINFEGRQYILPESSESHHCSLYEVNSAESSILLVHEPLIDPVLIQHNGRWWLFAHHLHHQNNAALFIYYNDDVNGKFKPHALNPVKTDIRNSRSAGPIMTIEGKLLRPAQDSSKTYGGAIVVNEITELTPDSYTEHEFKRIEPDRTWDYNKGIHTVSPLGPQRTLIDAKSFRFNFANFKAQWKRKSRRMTGK